MSRLRPWQLLPQPEPKSYTPSDTFFYENIAKYLIKDTVRIMANGLSIDLKKVKELELTLDNQLVEVENRLAKIPKLVEFQKLQHSKLVEEYIADRTEKLKTPESFIKPFNYKDMSHRSYFMYIWATRNNEPQPIEILIKNIPKWTVKDCKKFAKDNPIINKLLNGLLDDTNPIVKEAIDLWSLHKSDFYNEKFKQQIEKPAIDVPVFNPGSAKQKQDLFAWLGIESDKISKKTGLPSFDREVIEQINKENNDVEIKEITSSFIDHSFAAIVRNNFIEAFYNYTIQDRLYGTYKLLGAKSGRYTSNNP